MIAAMVVLSLSAISFAAVALVYAKKNGDLRVDNANARNALNTHKQVGKEQRARIAELTKITVSRGEQISSLYDELSSCDGDPNAAIDGLRGLLSPEIEVDDSAAGG